MGREKCPAERTLGSEIQTRLVDAGAWPAAGHCTGTDPAVSVRPLSVSLPPRRQWPRAPGPSPVTYHTLTTPG
jgi:hypothetical protein